MRLVVTSTLILLVGAATFATGISIQNEVVTAIGIGVTACSLVLLSLIWIQLVYKKARSQGDDSRVLPVSEGSMKRNKSDTNLELINVQVVKENDAYGDF
jgi:Sec-independent protein secretion pathway component TatC